MPKIVKLAHVPESAYRLLRSTDPGLRISTDNQLLLVSADVAIFGRFIDESAIVASEWLKPPKRYPYPGTPPT